MPVMMQDNRFWLTTEGWNKLIAVTNIRSSISMLSIVSNVGMVFACVYGIMAFLHARRMRIRIRKRAKALYGREFVDEVAWRLSIKVRPVGAEARRKHSAAAMTAVMYPQ